MSGMRELQTSICHVLSVCRGEVTWSGSMMPACSGVCIKQNYSPTNHFHKIDVFVHEEYCSFSVLYRHSLDAEEMNASIHQHTVASNMRLSGRYAPGKYTKH